MVRVFVRADSPMEVAGLEAIVRASRTLKLAGSSLGSAALAERLAEVRADVLLERVQAFSEVPEDLRGNALEETARPTTADEASAVPRVILADASAFAALAAALRAPEAGIRAVLPAWSSEREIQAAIESAAAGLIVVHPEVLAEALVPAPRAALFAEARGASLTARETQILNLLATGLANKEIAWQLQISEHTVKFHITSIFTKLDTSSRAEAVAIGIRRGLIAL
jgi:two-component system, NarL family, response regulator YdfI